MSLLGRPRLPAPILLPGGKSRLVRVLLPLVPYGNDVRIYAEPYCGSAALFFAKRPHPIEALNDLDQRLVNLFRTLQDPERFSRLKRRLRYTLYARAEFERALEILEREDADPVDRAWALFVARNQSFSGSMKVWGRELTHSVYGVAENVKRWLLRVALLRKWHQRLRMAQIDCVDALRFIDRWDTEEDVFLYRPAIPPGYLECGLGVHPGCGSGASPKACATSSQPERVRHRVGILSPRLRSAGEARLDSIRAQGHPPRACCAAGDESATGESRVEESPAEGKRLGFAAAGPALGAVPQQDFLRPARKA
jgi:hypothetical protein